MNREPYHVKEKKKKENADFFRNNVDNVALTQSALLAGI